MILDGSRVKELRIKSGLSQFKLSLELEMDRKLISLIENNERKQVWLCTAYKLAKYFNVKIEELIKE